MAKKNDTYIDPETGKRYKLSDFDDTHSWSRVKKKKNIKEDSSQAIPNLLGKT